MIVIEEMGDMFQVKMWEDKNQIKWIKYDDDSIVEF